MNTPTAFDRFDLRKALGNFGTGVTIVTTLSTDNRLVGVTANSFSSVSLDPPIVLWSLQKASPSLAAFDMCGRFIINVLASSQIELSRRFASRIPDKFNGVQHQPGIDGLPVIDGSAASFECRTVQRHDVGDHILYLGQVESYLHREHAALMYLQGQYVQNTAQECNAA